MTEYIQEVLLRTKDENLRILRQESNLTPQEIQKKFDRFREWYKYQPHLPRVEFSHAQLSRHFGLGKFVDENVRKKIDVFYSARTLMPEYFQGRDTWSDRVSKALESIELVLMPSVTEDNCRISILKININKLDNYDVNLACNCNFMLGDIRMYFDTISRDIYVWDFENMSSLNAKNFNIPDLRKIIFILQKCYSTPIKEIHIINASPITEIILSIIKAAMKKKVQNRIMIHSSMENFKKNFPIKYLPKDMGGDEPLTLKEISKSWEKALKTPEMRQWFLDLEKLKSDESKRVDKRHSYFNEFQDMAGTFRKLEVD